MTQHDERIEIFSALKAYGEKHNAEYYVVILTPPEGKRVKMLGSYQYASRHRGETGMIIDKVLGEKVFFPPTER